MSDAGWHQLVGDFVECRTDAAAFHDRFFELWHASSRRGHAGLPPDIETLFYIVEAYCPDPVLRDPNSPYEADEAELRTAADKALTQLPAPGWVRARLGRMMS